MPQNDFGVVIVLISLASASTGHCAIYNANPGVYWSLRNPTVQGDYTIRFESPFVPSPAGIIDPVNFQQFVSSEPLPPTAVPEPNPFKIVGFTFVILWIVWLVWAWKKR